MDKKSTKIELQHSTDQLIDIVNRFPVESWNISPEKGRWSAAQILDHVIISEGFITKLLDSQGTPCNDREPDEKILTVRALFTDDDLKLTAGEPIQPSNDEKNPGEQLDTFQTLRNLQLQILENHKLEHKVKLFHHPKFGELTRGEWLWFNILHSQRHTRQIQSLYDNQSR